MPNYLMVTGYGDGWLQSANITRYYSIQGDLDLTATEAVVQAIVRDSYTLADLFIRVTLNGNLGASTFRSRVNGGNGNLSVSIPASTDGTFQDLVNTDNYIVDDLVDYQVIAGVGGSFVDVRYIGIELQQVGNGGVGAESKSALMGAKLVAGKLI